MEKSFLFMDVNGRLTEILNVMPDEFILTIPIKEDEGDEEKCRKNTN